MKDLSTYIIESIQLNEKLSVKQAFVQWIDKHIFGVDTKEPHEQAKYIKSEIEKSSDGKVSVVIKRAKDIERDISNCINKDDTTIWNSHNQKSYTLEQAFKERVFWNTVELDDNCPFICFYAKNNKNLYYVWEESPWMLSTKDKNGNRDAKGTFMNLDVAGFENETYREYFKRVVFPQLIDPEGWKKQKEDEQKVIKKNTEERLKMIEKEIAELKQQLSK